MDILTIFYNTMTYVTGGDFFWASMGFTVATAMFVGAIIYDGNLSQAKKGLISVGIFALLFGQVTLSRVLGVFRDPILGPLQSQRPHMAFAGLATLILIALFWILGIYLGVLILHFKNRNKINP